MTDHTDEHGRPSHAADLPPSVARVQIHDTTVPNSTLRVTVEHPDHYRGVRSWLRSDREGVVRSVRSHLQREIDADVARVEVEDHAKLGVTEQELLDEERPKCGPAGTAVSGP